MSKKEFRQEWISAANKGDQNAITELYNYAYQDVYIVIQSMIRDDEGIVLDLLQDTFIKAFQKLHQLKKKESYLAWVKKIARNTTLDHLKKSRTILFAELSDDGDYSAFEPADEDLTYVPDIAIDRQETARLLHEILDSMSDGQRAVISMHYLQDMSIKEIAAALEKDEGTVKNQLHFGRKSLTKKVRELEKKQGIRLYSLAPLPLLLLLLRNMESVPVQPDAAVLGNVLHSSATTFSAGAAAQAAGSAVIKKGALGFLAATALTSTIIGYVVSKQPYLPTKDLFASDYSITFTGENGEGVAHVYCLDGYGLNYEVDPWSSLSNGDTVTLILSAPNGDDLEEYCAEHYGFIPSADSMEYIVSKLEDPE